MYIYQVPTLTKPLPTGFWYDLIYWLSQVWDWMIDNWEGLIIGTVVSVAVILVASIILKIVF